MSDQASAPGPAFPFDNTYARLPGHFHARVHPTPVSAPRLIKLNVPLTQLLQLDPRYLASAEGVEILAGNRIAPGSEPLAQAYAGHQFGHFVPQLGDGRANLLGELVGTDGIRYDIQLKGAGPTPFSRRGDGRAALGPVLREYLVSESMHALGVPTTRALAAVLTGDRVVRETMEPGGVFTRVARSHLRVGTFQFFAARNDTDALRTLAEYALDRHYPESAQAPKPYRALLDGVIGRHARLVAQWMSLGFLHGVMNTDNTSISGETLDFGPCAFMEAYDPDTVFSSIDQMGRYSYSNQPHAAHWNLTRLAEALLVLLADEEGSEEAALVSARTALSAFAPQYEDALLDRLRAKLGLRTPQPDDGALAQALLTQMRTDQVDFTLLFRRLCEAAEDRAADAAVRSLFAHAEAYDTWAITWRARLAQEPANALERARAMRLTNPAFIPRNHLVDRALRAAGERQDYEPFETLLAVLAQPFADQRPDLPGLNLTPFRTPAQPEERILHTFCGT